VYPQEYLPAAQFVVAALVVVSWVRLIRPTVTS
jgi:hypothetical protein